MTTCTAGTHPAAHLAEPMCTPPKSWRRLVSLCCLWLAGPSLIPTGAAAAAADEELEKFEYLQIRMGVPVEIQVYAADESLANQAAEAAYARMKELDRIMSDYDPDSELMRLCTTSTPGVPVEVSPDLAFVLGRSLDLSRRSEGAFDVTVGPVVDLWRIARRKKERARSRTIAGGTGAGRLRVAQVGRRDTHGRIAQTGHVA